MHVLKPPKPITLWRAIDGRLERAVGYPDPYAGLIASPFPGVFVFSLLEHAYCRAWLASFEAHKSESPNSMNRYGLILRDAGYGPLCLNLLRDIAQPLTDRLFPHVGRLRDYHGFLVDYEPNKQRALAPHRDESDVTLNICLGRRFSGGKLLFRNEHTRKVECEIDHRVGQAVLHLGSHYHQAKGVKTGKRTNLILWCSR